MIIEYRGKSFDIPAPNCTAVVSIKPNSSLAVFSIIEKTPSIEMTAWPDLESYLDNVEEDTGRRMTGEELFEDAGVGIPEGYTAGELFDELKEFSHMLLDSDYGIEDTTLDDGKLTLEGNLVAVVNLLEELEDFIADDAEYDFGWEY